MESSCNSLTFSGFESWILLVSVICLPEVNHINVGFVDGPDVVDNGTDSHWHGAVDSRHRDSFRAGQRQQACHERRGQQCGESAQQARCQETLASSPSACR